MNDSRVMVVKKSDLFPGGDNHFVGYRPLEDSDYTKVILDRAKFLPDDRITDQYKRVFSFVTLFRPAIEGKPAKVYLFAGLDMWNSIALYGHVSELDDQKAKAELERHKRTNVGPMRSALTLGALRVTDSQIDLSSPGVLDDPNGFVNFDTGPYAQVFGRWYCVKADTRRKTDRQTKAVNLKLMGRVEITTLEDMARKGKLDQVSRVLVEPMGKYLENLVQ